MKKSHFTNRTIYWIITVAIGGLMLWNFYVYVLTGQLVALLPLLIQGILLWLIIYNHRYAKIAIRLWAIIFLCIASGLQFFGRLLQDFVEGFVNNDSTYYLRSGAHQQKCLCSRSNPLFYCRTLIKTAPIFFS